MNTSCSDYELLDSRRPSPVAPGALLTLSPAQVDALQEIVNLGMGRAGDALARMLDAFVELSVPRLQLVDSSHLGESLALLIPEPARVLAVRQAFFRPLRGECLMLFLDGSCREMADLMDYDDELDAAGEEEVVLELTNILVGACMGSVAEQLVLELSFSPPVLMARDGGLEALARPKRLSWRYALIFEVNFRIEARGFVCHLVSFLPESTVETMRQAVDAFLEGF